MSMKKSIVSKPLGRPSSGSSQIDTKKPTTMEVLAPDKSPAEENMLSKSGSAIKKEIRLERAVSGGTSSFDDYMKAKQKEYGDQKVIPMPKDQLKPNQTEEFKKISSKPFDKKAKKGTVSAEVSSTRTGLQSTAINSSDTGSEYGSDSGKMKFMGEIVPTTMNILDENKVNYSNSFWKVSEKETVSKKDIKKQQQPPKKEVYESDEEEDDPIENFDIDFEISNKKIEEMQKKYSQKENFMQQYLNHIKNTKDDEGKNLVMIPSNFDAVVEIAFNEQKVQDDLLEKGLIEEEDKLLIQSNRDKIIDTMMENQEPQKKEKMDPYAQEKKKIKELDKVLAEKENKYRDLKNKDKIRKVNESHDDLSEMSTEDIKSKLFITEYKKKNIRQSIDQLQAQKKKLELAQAQLKNETIATKNTQIDRSEYANDFELSRVQAMFLELEREAEDGEERSIFESNLFANPYKNDELQTKLREIDEKLVEYNFERPQTKDEEYIDLPKDKYLREIAEERYIREKSDALTKKLMIIAEKEQNGELEDPQILSKLIEELKKDNYLPNLTPLIPFDSLEEVAKQSTEILLSYKPDELLKDLNSMNKDYEKVGKEIKKLREEMNKKITSRETEIQEKEKKRKIMDYLKEINSKQDQIGKIFSESVNAEADLLNNLERKLNELKNKDEESEYKLESFNRNVEEIVTPIEEQSLTAENKSIQDYDKEISEKVYQLHLGVPSLDEEKDQKFEEDEDEGPYVDLEELKKKYGIKDEDIDY